MYLFIPILRLLLIFLVPAISSAQLHRFEYSANKMGAPFSLILYHTDSVQARQAAVDCFRLVDSLERIFSDYSGESETGRFNARPDTGLFPVSVPLFQLLLASQQAWKKSRGSFDVTIGRLSQLWRKARQANQFPAPDAVAAAKSQTGFAGLVLLPARQAVRRQLPGLQLDFGGIVPGYVADEVIRFLHQKNIHQALVDASGDIVVSDPPPGKPGWSIAINKPESEDETWEQKLLLSNAAVSTSGDLYRYLLHDGKKYSHIIDPKTGYGLTSLRNVTVIASSGIGADWLATACSVLEPGAARKLAKKNKAGLFIAIAGDDKVRIYKNRKFELYFQNDSR